MEDLRFPAGLAWATEVSLRGVPRWGRPESRRLGSAPHPGGLIVPVRRPRLNTHVTFSRPGPPPAGPVPKFESTPRVGGPFISPYRSGSEQLALTRGAHHPGRWVYLFGRAGRFPSLGWSRGVSPVVSPVRRGGNYQKGYLVRLAQIFSSAREPLSQVPRVVSRSDYPVPNRGTTRLGGPEDLSDWWASPAVTFSGDETLSNRAAAWETPTGTTRVGRLTRTTRKGLRPPKPTGVVRSTRSKLFSLTVVHRKVKNRFLRQRPHRLRRRGIGKLARRHRTFAGDLRRRWRSFLRPRGWRPPRRWTRRRWRHRGRRRKWLEKRLYRHFKRYRRGRPRRGPPRGGRFLGFRKVIPWTAGSVRFRRLRRLRRAWNSRRKLWTPRKVYRRQRNVYLRRRSPRGGRSFFRIRRRRVDPARPRFWKFRSPRKWTPRKWLRRRVHLRRGAGVTGQLSWWLRRSKILKVQVSRWGGNFTFRGVPRGGLVRKIFRTATAGIFQRLEWSLRVGLAHYPRTRAGSLQRIACLGSPRGGSSLARKWLKKASATRGDRNWFTRVAAELTHPTRAIRSREDYLKVAVAGGALL